MERNIINASNKFTKRDLFNTTGGKSLQDIPTGSSFEVVSAAIVDTVNEKGEPTELTVLVTPDTVYSSISPVVRKQTDFLIDMLDDEDKPIVIALATGTSKSGREYLTLKLV